MIDPEKQIPLIKKALEADEWGGDDLPEDERDVLLMEEDGSHRLVFRVPFAIERYMDPVSALISQKIK